MAGGRSSSPTPVSTCGATPTARFYLVDHTGTRRLPRTPTNPNPGEEPRSPVAIELWHSPVALELDYAA